ncbi:MAG TPA: hypothetical protein VFM68_00735 [Candidatus Saccharimonadales bacterium]|nr:hypothetical protein [Candidatus Saccharimonadales bacterium]
MIVLLMGAVAAFVVAMLLFCGGKHYVSRAGKMADASSSPKQVRRKGKLWLAGSAFCLMATIVLGGSFFEAVLTR